MGSDQFERLKFQLKELNLKTTLEIFEREALDAAKTKQSHIGYLSKLVEEECLARTDRSINRKVQTARFPQVKTLEEFDFSFQPGINEKEIQNLATLSFIDKKENIILMGPPGVGKSHLAIALGVKACIAKYRVLFTTANSLVEQLYNSVIDNTISEKLEHFARIHLMVIDELGYMPIDKERANLFFQLITRRYETGSIILTTNLPFDQWDMTFGDSIISSAIIDRLAHHCHIISINGNSYRMKDKLHKVV